MSDYGSYVTDCFVCPRCMDAVSRVISETLDSRYPPGRVTSRDRSIGVIAGVVSGLYPGEEIDVFRDEIVGAVAERVCHPVTIVVLAETGEVQKFKILPNGGVIK